MIDRPASQGYNYYPMSVFEVPEFHAGIPGDDLLHSFNRATFDGDFDQQYEARLRFIVETLEHAKANPQSHMARLALGVAVDDMYEFETRYGVSA